MRIRSIVAVVIAATLAIAPVAAQDDDSRSDIQRKREAVDDMALGAMEDLFEQSATARDLYQKSAGYAVFDNLKVTFIVTGGGGVGVAVNKETGRQTYMKMGTGGLALGIGGQSYQVVFLFEDTTTLQKFIDKGWQAEAGATAAAGTSGANAPTTFRNGVAVFQMTNKGLVAQADVTGTKYWKHKKLNRGNGGEEPSEPAEPAEPTDSAD